MLEFEVLSEFIKELIKNAKSLLDEARILIKYKKIQRATFLTVIAIEELGKITMYFNSIQYSKDNTSFWKKFNKYKIKHDFKIFKSIVFNKYSELNLNFNFDTLESLSKRIQKIKLNSLYVDLKKDKIISPFKSTELEDFNSIYNFALKLLKYHQNNLKLGLYNANFMNEFKEFYNDPKIKIMQEKLFEGKLLPEEYIGNLVSVAQSKKDNNFANFLLFSFYYVLKKGEGKR